MSGSRNTFRNWSASRRFAFNPSWRRGGVERGAQRHCFMEKCINQSRPAAAKPQAVGWALPQSIEPNSTIVGASTAGAAARINSVAASSVAGAAHNQCSNTRCGKSSI